MELKISTPILKKYIGSKIKLRKKYSSLFINCIITEIHNRQLNIGCDWISFDKIASIELLNN